MNEVLSSLAAPQTQARQSRAQEPDGAGDGDAGGILECRH